MNDLDGAIVPPGGRGCGTREGGGVYVEVGLSPWGRPVEHFLVDPPVRVDAKGLGLSSIGVKLVFVPDGDCTACKGEGTVLEGAEPGVYDILPEIHRVICPACDGKGYLGTWHIFDIVGQKHYPNVADFVEETRRFGVSRRCELASAEEYAKLTPQSRLVLLHQRAWVGAFETYAREWVPGYYDTCPKHLTAHLERVDQIRDRVPQKEEFCCAGVWWQDLQWDTCEQEPVEPEGSPTISAMRYARGRVRKMPSFWYNGAKSPSQLIVEARGYQLAIFAKFPITRLVVVRGEAELMAKKRAKVAKTSLPVDEVDE